MIRSIPPPGIAGNGGISTGTVIRPPAGAGGTSGRFADALERAERSREVVFSAHAADRLSRRGIRFGDSDRARLADAVSAAREKGGRNSLVLLGSTALIVNVPNRTVVTAMGTGGSAGERVITNIDSAVIA